MLRQTEESSDFGSTLGTKALGVDDISETWDIALALLDNGQSQHGQILSDDAATDGLALSFTGSSGSVAGVAIGEEELDTGGEHLDKSQHFVSCAGAFREQSEWGTYDALLHRKALLVIAAGDADDLVKRMSVLGHVISSLSSAGKAIRSPSIHHPDYRLALRCPCACP